MTDTPSSLTNVNFKDERSDAKGHNDDEDIATMGDVEIDDGSVKTTTSATGEITVVNTPPAKDVLEEMNKSWRRVNGKLEPLIQWVGRRADYLLRRMNIFDTWRGKRGTIVPVIAIVIVCYYILEVSMGLVIRDMPLFIAWEELFVISVFLFEWIATTKPLRMYIATELSAAKQTQDAEDRAINRLAALAQSDPMTIVIIAAVLLRLVVRASIFLFRPLFVTETALELVVVFIFSLYMVLIVAASSRLSKTQGKKRQEA